MNNPVDIQKLLVDLAKAAKAQKKPEYLDALVNVSWDYAGKRVTGSFAFPLQATTNEETGQVTFEVVDFLVPSEPPKPPEEESESV